MSQPWSFVDQVPETVHEELEDEEIDRIHDEAIEAARLAPYPVFLNSDTNPYPPGTTRHAIYAFAYRNAYANENGF